MVNIDEIQKAARIIRGNIIRTPLVYSPTFSRTVGAQVFLKLENLQKTGSFKIRGAIYKILFRSDEIGPQGVVAASAGNHAQGVALAAKQAGIPSTIVMPRWASLSKQEATQNYGGEVLIHGESIGESIEKARELTKEGKTFIHPYDDPDIITGQGTIALEIFEDLSDPDLILVPVGGGGLISGIATAAKTIRPKTRVVGVQAAACPSAFESIRRKKLVQIETQGSIADGITIKQMGEITFEVIKRCVDDILLVEEDQIALAILSLLERKKVLAEGAGAVPLAAVLDKGFRIRPGGKIVLVISGGNVDSPLVGRIIRQGLFRNGRIMTVSIPLDDVPGSLARLLSRIANHNANVLHIYHTRGGSHIPIQTSIVELELETRGHAHIDVIQDDLRSAGYRILPSSYDTLGSLYTE